MAIETSGSHRITQIRAITIIGAGAAILAVIGFLLMKSDRKKPKRRSSKSASKTEISMDKVEVNITEKSELATKQLEPNHEKKINKDIQNLVESCNSLINQIGEKKNADEQTVELSKSSESPELDKVSLASSDSGNGHEIEDEHKKPLEETVKPEEVKPEPEQPQQKVEKNVETVEKPQEIKESDSNNNKIVKSVVNNNNVKDKKKVEENKENQSTPISKSNQPSQQKPTSQTPTNKNEKPKKAPAQKQPQQQQQQPQQSGKKMVTSNSFTNSPSATSQSGNKNSLMKRSISSTSPKGLKSHCENEDIKLKSNKKSDSDLKSKQAGMSSSNKNIAQQNRALPKLDVDSTQVEDLVAYEFNFPRKFCGKLIGKNGVHVDYIRSKTHTQIAVRNDPNVEDLQIVCVSGRLEDVDQALDIISNRFPVKHYPQISFKPISNPIVYRRYNPEKNVLFNESKVLVAPNMFVQLDGVLNVNTPLSPPMTPTITPSLSQVFQQSKPNENQNAKIINHTPINVHVTAVVNAAHVFIQLPNHPTYDNLQKLDEKMLSLYSSLNDDTVPMMIEPIEYGTICAAPTSYGWHRAMVTSYQTYDEASKEIPDYQDKCGLATVKFLDYGGYLTIPANQLRQLRSDFMLLPFQAVECYLDGIFPIEGTEENGKSHLSNLLKNSSLKAVITGYADDSLPIIKLYQTNDHLNNVNVNDELVKSGYAYYFNVDYTPLQNADPNPTIDNQYPIVQKLHQMDNYNPSNEFIKNEQTIN